MYTYIYTSCHVYIFLQVARETFEPTSVNLSTISKNGMFLPTTSNILIIMFYSGEDFHQCICVYIHIHIYIYHVYTYRYL